MGVGAVGVGAVGVGAVGVGVGAVGVGVGDLFALILLPLKVHFFCGRGPG